MESLGLPWATPEEQQLQEKMCHRETDLILKHKQIFETGSVMREKRHLILKISFVYCHNDKDLRTNEKQSKRVLK